MVPVMTIPREPLGSVNISEQAKTMKHVKTTDEGEYYIDSNGLVHVYERRNLPITTAHAGYIARSSQATPTRSRTAHSTSFPEGALTNVDLTKVTQGMPSWLLFPQAATGESQQSTGSASTSTMRSTQNLTHIEGNATNMDEQPDDSVAFRPQAASKQAERFAPTPTKSKKVKAGKRRADQLEVDDETTTKATHKKPSPSKGRKRT
jgi:hypothetical protein